MNPDTGAVYPSLADAMTAGEKPNDLVEISGTAEQVGRISQAVRESNRRKNKAARKARRANR